MVKLRDATGPTATVPQGPSVVTKAPEQALAPPPLQLRTANPAARRLDVQHKQPLTLQEPGAVSPAQPKKASSSTPHLDRALGAHLNLQIDALWFWDIVETLFDGWNSVTGAKARVYTLASQATLRNQVWLGVIAGGAPLWNELAQLSASDETLDASVRAWLTTKAPGMSQEELDDATAIIAHELRTIATFPTEALPNLFVYWQSADATTREKLSFVLSHYPAEELGRWLTHVDPKPLTVAQRTERLTKLFAHRNVWTVEPTQARQVHPLQRWMVVMSVAEPAGQHAFEKGDAEAVRVRVQLAGGQALLVWMTVEEYEKDRRRLADLAVALTAVSPAILRLARDIDIEPQGRNTALASAGGDAVNLYPSLDIAKLSATGTLLHEFGHRIHQTPELWGSQQTEAWLAAVKSDGTYPSVYAMSGWGEDFAESLVMYHLAPETLRHRCPARYAFVKAMLARVEAHATQAT